MNGLLHALLHIGLLTQEVQTAHACLLADEMALWIRAFGVDHNTWGLSCRGNKVSCSLTQIFYVYRERHGLRGMVTIVGFLIE